MADRDLDVSQMKTTLAVGICRWLSYRQADCSQPRHCGLSPFHAGFAARALSFCRQRNCRRMPNDSAGRKG
jgi:hypothetical protein